MLWMETQKCFISFSVFRLIFFILFFTQFLARLKRQKRAKVFWRVSARFFECFGAHFQMLPPKFWGRSYKNIWHVSFWHLTFFLSIGHASFIVLSLSQVNNYWINELRITNLQELLSLQIQEIQKYIFYNSILNGWLFFNYCFILPSILLQPTNLKTITI